MNFKKISPSKSAITLGFITLVVTVSVFWLKQWTGPIIETNYQNERLKKFHQLIKSSDYDNNLLEDATLWQQYTIYPAYQDGQLRMVFVEATSKDGYSGDIRLILAILTDNTLKAVTVLNHRETPGLGDRIERKKSNWITQFFNKNLTQTQWNLADKGHKGSGFDSLTGATISSKAVVATIREVSQNSAFIIEEFKKELVY